MFLLPLLVLYELGTWLFATDAQGGTATWIYARSILRDFFEVMGVSGVYLPGLIVVVVLLSWHAVRRDPWKIEPRLYGFMWLESVLLALPLYVFALVIFRQPLMQAALAGAVEAAPPDWRAQLVFSIGAGIYEELLFRLIAIALLHLILVDLLALPAKSGAAGAVLLSALAFAIYHFSDQNPFTVGKLIFYTAAGVYLAVVYVLRGFGVVVGTHAVYDILVVAI